MVDHSVTSNDPNYQGIFVDGIGLTVGGAAGALIQQDPLTVVHANDPTSIASFVVTMPQTYAFSVNTKVFVNVSAAQVSSQTVAAGGQGVELSLDGHTWTEAARPRWPSMQAIGRADSGSTCARSPATST